VFYYKKLKIINT